MIESVQVRQRGAFDFETHYQNLCALQDSCPMTAVKAHLSQGVLDLNGDRVRAADWVPVLNTLRINKSLEFVAFRSFYTPPATENEKNLAIHKRKMPAIRSKEITYRLCKALRECLTISTSLTCLELQGLPLRERDLTSLTKGLFKSSALSHLSLEYCRIGDNGLDIICRGIKNSATINSINLTGCSLTWKGADCLAKVVKHQAMRRHNEAWRDSLRYRRPDLDRMPGIRRITINNNPMLSDQGAILLAEALKDDLWLKALDLQACGISSPGARSLLDVLKYNTTIVVLDVRRNPLIERDVMHSIMEQLMLNCNGQDTEYKWIKAEEPADQSKPNLKGPVRKRRTKTLNISFGRKATIRVPVSSARRRTKSAGAAGGGARNQGNVAQLKSTGLPWRTAARANRHRGFPPEHAPHSASMYETSEMSSLSDSPTNHGASVIVTQEDSAAEDTFGELGKFNLDESNLNAEIKNVRGVRVEMEQLRRRLREETEARKSAEQRVMRLTLENERLKGEVIDDLVLETIETSFKQFHAFLDLLRDAGWGKLISIAGLDQGAMPFGQGNTSATFPSRLGQNGTSARSNPMMSASHMPAQTPLQRSLYTGGINSMVQVSTSYGSYEEGQPIVFGPNTDTGHSVNLKAGPSNVGLPAPSALLNLPKKSAANIGDPTMQQTPGLDESYKVDHDAMTADELYEKLVQDTRGILDTDWDAKLATKSKTTTTKSQKLSKDLNSDSDVVVPSVRSRKGKGEGQPDSPRSDNISPGPEKLYDVRSSDEGRYKDENKVDNPVHSDMGQGDKGGNTGMELPDHGTPDLGSVHSEGNYSMDGFEPSYVSERGEVIHLGDDLDDLLGLHSSPGLRSEDDGF